MAPKKPTMPDSYPSSELIDRAVEILSEPLPKQGAARSLEISRRMDLVTAVLAIGDGPHVAQEAEDDEALPLPRFAAG
jgi:hypothetical protein